MPATARYTTLRLLLGDQLNESHSWFAEPDASVLTVIAELEQETRYVKHHVQKLCAFFAAMAEFAKRLQAQGHAVLHLTLDDTSEYDDLGALIGELAERYQITRFEFQRPDEYRLLRQLRAIKPGPQVHTEECDSEHFLLPFADIDAEFSPGKAHRMEAFYRRMRKRLDILMEAGEPAGGRWNFDQENRNKLRPDDLDSIPEPLLFDNNVEAVLARLEAHGVKSFGQKKAILPWPISRHQALQLLDHFCRHCLPGFGRFQDAMTATGEQRWSLYHSRLSFALNAKLLSPKEVIDTAIRHFQNNDRIDLAQIEGFVRQILGWREFIRAMYWINMPDYTALNALSADRDLPAWFWNAKTDMRCLQQALGQSLEHAYAHHIQRLMIIGNFCLLTGIDPDQVDAWYLGVYIDAIEWVELPNTRGMALYADNGLVGSKPYAAGGNYIRKMSDYCQGCRYKVGAVTGDNACPFNSLYWHFMHRHRTELEQNSRLRVLYGSWDKRPRADQKAVLSTARRYLDSIESL